MQKSLIVFLCGIGCLSGSGLIKLLSLWSTTANLSIPWLFNVMGLALLLNALHVGLSLSKQKIIVLVLGVTCCGMSGVCVDSGFALNDCWVDLSEVAGFGIIYGILSWIIFTDGDRS